MNFHYEVVSKPDPETNGQTGIYDVVRMEGDLIIRKLATFKGYERDRAFTLAGELQKEMTEWELSRKIHE